MGFVINYDIRPHLHEFREDGRLALLTALLLHANPRLRCYVSMKTLAKESGWSLGSLDLAKEWLLERAAIVLVPFKKRVEDELLLPRRQHVYQLTGFIALQGKLVDYLYLNPDSHATIKAMISEILTAEILATKISASEISPTRTKVITLVTNYDLSNKLDKSPDKANRLSDSAILAIALDAKHKPLLVFLAEFSPIPCNDLDEQFGEEVRGYLEDHDFIERHDPAMWGGMLCSYSLSEKGKQALEAKLVIKPISPKHVKGEWITGDKPVAAKKGRKAFTLTDQHIEILQFVEKEGEFRLMDESSFSGVDVINLVEKGYLELHPHNLDDPAQYYETNTLTPKGYKAIGKKKPRERDPLFDAISELLFEGTESGGLVGKAKSALLKDFPSATAQDVAAFVEWYKDAKPNMSLPGWQKLPKEYAKWVKAGSPNGVNVAIQDSELHTPSPKWILE